MQKNSALILVLFFYVLNSGFQPTTGAEKNRQATGNFIPVSPDVYLFKDICNVYVLKSGTSALLIDAGSGEVKNHLKEIGVETVELVLHTHYHRDQTSGSAGLKKSGAQIAIGGAESHLLERDESITPFKTPDWIPDVNVQIWGRNTPPDTVLFNGELPGWGRRMAPFTAPGVDRKLTDGEVINWNQYRIRVMDTPGHTWGSVSFLTETAGKTICFTGDLIMKGGHIRDLYSMQWIYLRNPGLDSSLISLEKVKAANPDILLPAHGATIDQPSRDMNLLNIRLKKVRDAFNYPRSGRWNWSEFIQVSEHVVQDGGSTTQIVISNSGEALLFDCGEEFSPERLEEAKAKFGIKRVDVIIPSHWHFDHVDGIAKLADAEGAELWVWEGLAEHVEFPERFPTTCWTGPSIKIDRVLKEKKEFEWGGYSFKVFHNPVHTEQQIALYARVDRRSFYMMADGTGFSKDGRFRSSIHCYNDISLATGLIKTAHSISQAKPYICLPAHSNVFAITGGETGEFVHWATETTDAIRALLYPPYQELGFSPYWAAFYPARVHVQAGESVEIALRLRNYTNQPIAGQYRLKGYGNITFDKEVAEYALDPGETKDFPVRVTTKKSAGNGIHIVTADIGFGHQVFGEYPQGYIEISQ
jgi:glyoxylase-like metal-dependent hydrolase (beta-lactamase superfamily II)